jgi:[protein-PII] uridylyltransferase
MPEFGRVVAQMQHDMYHVYTVDEHSIRAVGVLASIERGELKEDHPLSDEIVHKVLSRDVLYVSVLLHDIAKGRGGNHSELGAEVAEKLGPTLGLSEAETETAAWLVRHHLLMSATAFKRDIADPKTVEDFVATVQSLERLRLLVVLTVADIRAVGPGRWNGWKGQLLRDLYERAAEVMSGGHGADAAAARVAVAKERLAEQLADWSADEVAAHAARAYNSYWLSLDTETQARHARMMRQADRDAAPLTIETRVDRFKAVTEVTLYTPDHSGLFAAVAGAMAVSGANIVDAKIFTTSDGMAIDSFLIQDAERGAFERPEKLAKLSANIEETLAGRLRPRQALEKRRGLPSRTRVFTVAPQVFVDNAASNTHTVIEVNGRDRPGFLHEVTRTLTDLGLTISSAHVSTFGERAVDVFYVKDVFGLKVTHEGKLKIVREKLLAALVDPDAAKSAEPATTAAE